MSDQPLISIIMNCHNGEKYLKDSIKSILDQTYQNWELIFYDNNSNDKSKQIFFEFRDKRLKNFYSQKTLKLYKARNLAINQSKGTYISFLISGFQEEISILSPNKFTIAPDSLQIFKVKSKYLFG